MPKAEKLNYVEYPARDLVATKAFFAQAFNWEFEDYGPDYCAFFNQGLDGGFYSSDVCSTAKEGSALLVLLSEDLEATQAKVKAAGGTIIRDIFDFPGGRRFHFTEPSGNELAVWSLPLCEKPMPEVVPSTIPPTNAESFRFIGGFNDIFIVIACALLLFSSFWASRELVSDSVGLAVFAALSWGLAEFFVRQRNMVLPAIALLAAFVGSVFFFAISLYMQDLGSSLIVATVAATVAAYAHWWRFKVPMTIAVGVAAAIGLVMVLIVELVPLAENYLLLMLFVAGVLTFALAMYWDASDTDRLTNRSDVSFWLHILSAPLVTHPLFANLAAPQNEAYLMSTLVILVCYLLITIVSLVIDRRAFMVSSLVYVLYALGNLLHTFGSDDIGLALTGVLAGSALLLLASFWNSARAVIVNKLPMSIRSWVPAVM